MSEIVDPFEVPGGSLPEVPVRAPSPGEFYLGLPVAQSAWRHPAHAAWAKRRQSKGLEPPFYVQLPSGVLAWVPWPGSALVAEDDQAWEMDMLEEGGGSDFKREKKPK